MRKKKKTYNYYRRVRTTAEHRANGSRKDHDLYGWARPKRCGLNLPSSYDDQHQCVQKTWKVKREKQYRVGPRGERHEVYLHDDCFTIPWKFKEHCEEYEIPYATEIVKDTVSYQERKLKVTNEDTGEVKYVWSRYTNYWWHRTIEETDEVRTRYEGVTVGYNLIWWADKDIGIDYIVRSIRSVRMVHELILVAGSLSAKQVINGSSPSCAS